MKTIGITIVLLIISAIFTQVLAGPGGPPATPIDGGLSLLLAGGVAYGIKKMKSRNS